MCCQFVKRSTLCYPCLLSSQFCLNRKLITSHARFIVGLVFFNVFNVQLVCSFMHGMAMIKLYLYNEIVIDFCKHVKQSGYHKICTYAKNRTSYNSEMHGCFLKHL